jgi:hypothetical protein
MKIWVSLAVGAAAIGVFAFFAIRPSPSQPPKSSPSPEEIPQPTDDDGYVHPRGYICYRASKSIVIDGRLDDEAWAAVPWSEDFVDIEGDKKAKPRFRTRVKMLWDDEYLYIAAEMQEPHVGALLTKHDSYIFYDDHDFEVFLDPDGDSHLYAELEINALNTTWDLLLTKPYKDDGCAIDAWEIEGLRTAVHVDGTINDPSDTDRGWTVEIAWPWKGLKQIASCPVPPCDGDQWRINFSRVELKHEFRDGRYRKVKGSADENWVWSPQGAVNMHLPERWGYLQFSIEPPGAAAFCPDAAGPAKHALHRIYYAQAKYHKKHGRWATELRQLGLANLRGENFGKPKLETTSTRYESNVDVQLPGGVERWHIESDARVWKD